MARRENWFKHDIDSPCVPKMQAFINKTGAIGYGFFWRVVEEMHRTEQNEQTRTNVNIIGQTLKLDEQTILMILESAISLGLWEQKGDFICSKRAKKEMTERVERLNDISNKRSKAGQRSGEVRRTKPNKREQTRTKVNQRRGEERRVDTISIESASDKQPFPTPDSPVLLTENEIEKLTDTLGQERFDFLTGELANYASNKPKAFKQYKSHYLTLLNWNKLRIQDGKDFYIHEQHGPGYYKQPQR
jgi:hypothetical protein